MKFKVIGLLGLLLLAAWNDGTRTIRVRKSSMSQGQVLLHRLQSGRPVEPGEFFAAADVATACDQFKANLPVEMETGTVEVPENWSKPNGKKIKVFYYGVWDAKSNDVPVVYYNGGPASDSHSSYEILAPIAAKQRLSFVYIDQRGTGCSDPFPDKVYSDEAVEVLSHYGSRSIVLDSEAVRAKLFGTRKWKAFGQSYGGLIVHRYLQVAPDSLVSANAHGFSIMTDKLDWLVMRVQSQYRVAEDFFKQYPADRDNLRTIRSLIGSDYCFDNGVSKICGPQVMDAATLLLGFQTAWPSLDKWINTILPASGSLNETALKQFVETYAGFYVNNGFAGTVIGAVEIVPGWPDSQVCPEVRKRLMAKGLDPDSWDINECRLLSSFQSQWDPFVANIKVEDSLELSDLDGILNNHPDLPFYLYSGAKDVFVPVDTFIEESGKLGNLIHYHNFDDSGHEGFYTEDLVWQNLAK